MSGRFHLCLSGLMLHNNPSALLLLTQIFSQLYEQLWRPWLRNNNLQSLKWSFGPHLTHRQAFILWNHRNSQTLQNHTFLQGKSLNKTALVFHYLFGSKIMFSKSQDGRFAAFLASSWSHVGCGQREGLHPTEPSGRSETERMRHRPSGRATQADIQLSTNSWGICCKQRKISFHLFSNPPMYQLVKIKKNKYKEKERLRPQTKWSSDQSRPRVGRDRAQTARAADYFFAHISSFFLHFFLVKSWQNFLPDVPPTRPSMMILW